MELEDEEVDKTKVSSCSGLRQELKDCILKSDCVIKHGNHPRDCLKAEAEGAEECRKLQYAFLNAKDPCLISETDSEEGKATN